ncbi:MAG: SGNH/GDSL hydrolase family protein [Ignavibacteriae bacterium]|nr:SGNH/GDSL hydrolase family protein [Ignavibacteriota bacterium]
MNLTSHLSRILCLLAVLVGPIFAAENSPDSLTWYEPPAWSIEGRGWTDVKRAYDRLPAHAENVVRRPVWDLSRQSAGMSVQFRTDAQEIQVRYSLLRPALAKPHMAATGVSGADLYVTTETGEWRWVGTVLPEDRIVRAPLIKQMSPGIRTYRLYLPLYNGVDSLALGVPHGSRFEPIAAGTGKSIVFYGTSIMQGACASRPGMAITAILGRRLDQPTINLGFSGNGWMEPELADLLGELDATVYALDCLPNMKPAQVRERVEPFVRKLRAVRPKTPIILVEGRIFPNAFALPERRSAHDESHAALRAIFEKLQKEGMPALYYLKSDDLLGSDGEGTVDGSHPTDLGMMRYADAYEVILRRALRGE